jgi:hypothetical protein
VIKAADFEKRSVGFAEGISLRHSWRHSSRHSSDDGSNCVDRSGKMESIEEGTKNDGGQKEGTKKEGGQKVGTKKESSIYIMVSRLAGGGGGVG